MAKFEIGNRVRVKIRGTRGERQSSFDMQSTNTVTEGGPTYWTHYLFLGSGRISESNDVLTADFDAAVVGEYTNGRNSTTLVQEISKSGSITGCQHFVYLDSEAVERLEQYPDGGYRTKAEQEAIGKPALGTAITTTVYQTGDKIRVSFDAVLGSTSANGPFGTDGARETAGTRAEHYLFLPSGLVTGNKTTGGEVHVEFNGTITGVIKAEPASTTAVREIRADGTDGFNHALYLNSSGIAKIEPELTPAEALSLKGTTVSIDQYDDEITYRMVRERIEDLEESVETEYEVIRVRNDEVLGTFPDEEKADQYIEDNDYNPDRVIARETDADEEDVNELSDLGELDADCQRQFGSAWGENNVTLYRDDYFDADWARNRASEELGISFGSTDEWPLDLVDWQDAAELKRDADYTLIDFDGAKFYGAGQ
jgi:hypothetical protein